MSSNASKNLPTNEICRLFHDGKSVREIAQIFHCSHNSIRCHLRKGGMWPASANPEQEKNMKKTRNPNRQRDIINYIMESTEEVFTIESVSKQFGCTREVASAILSSIVKRGLGLERSIRGTYKKSAAVKKKTQQTMTLNFSDDGFHGESHNNNSVWPSYRPTGGRPGTDYLQTCQAIIDLARLCGGMDTLIARATELKRQGYGV